MPPPSGISENYALARKIHAYHDLNSRAELYVVTIYHTQETNNRQIGGGGIKTSLLMLPEVITTVFFSLLSC